MNKIRILQIFVLLLITTTISMTGFVKPDPAYAASFTAACTGTDGDEASLIAAITSANTTAGADEVVLGANCIYTLTTVDNTTDGPNGLPAIIASGGDLKIIGNGATIERSTAGGTPDFRFFHITGVTFILSNVILQNGSAPLGGAVYVNTGVGALFNNAFLDNTAQGSITNNQGGAVYNASGTAYIINNTFSGNSAQGGTTNQGGAVYNASGGTTLRFNTLTQNSADTGGAVFKSSNYTDLFNNIIAGNTAATDPDVSGVFNIWDGNFIEDVGAATGAGGTNNRVGLQASTLIESTLALNGGLTPGYALLAGSPAINAASGTTMNDTADLDNDADTTEVLPYDQRGVAGFSRQVGTRYDVGSYEYQCPAIMPDPVTTVTELYQAIHRANCDGVDSTINLAPGTTFTLTAVASLTNGSSGLPDILSDGRLTINGNGATIERSTAVGTPSFRLLYVSSNPFFTLKNVVLQNGIASQGGAVFVQGGTMAFFNNTWRNNTAQGSATTNQGGALYNNGSGIYLVNNTFSANSATGGTTNQGGAVYNSSGTILIRHNTFTQNTASEGGAVYKAGGVVDLYSNIIAGNTAPTNPDVAGAFNSGDYNFIGDVGTATGIAGTNNRFGMQVSILIDPTLALNGGLTLTHALLSSSPAISAGGGINLSDVGDIDADSDTSEALPLDQRGVIGSPRQVSTRVDAGSLEYQCPATMSNPVTTVTELYEAIHRANCDGVDSTINLAPGTTFTLTAIASLTNGSSGLPDILPDGRLTINGNGAIIERSTAGGTPNFRLLYVASNTFFTLKNVVLQNGIASQGGAVFVQGGTMAFFNNTWRNNTAQGSATTNQGGALYNNFAGIYLSNNTFSGNSATGGTTNQGGAVYNSSGTILIRHNTFTQNSASEGGAVFKSGGVIDLYSNIIAGNTAPTNPDVAGAFNGGDYNFIGDVGTATGITGTGNRFGMQASNLIEPTLALNGGLTPTHALLSSSSAINAVSGIFMNDVGDIDGDTNTSEALPYDQRGVTGSFRQVSTRVDVGAFEYQCPATMPDPVTTVPELYQAIHRANCDGVDSTINLAPGTTFTLTAVASLTNGSSGLPDIISDGRLTINGNGAIIERSTAGGTSNFRLFYVNGNPFFTLKNVVLRNGVASQGGAIYTQNSTMALFNNTWLSNTAQGSATTNQGGALYNSNGLIYLSNNTFSGNSASSGTTNQGGAVYHNNGTFYVRHNTFTQNSADDGGAIYKFGGYTDLYLNIITGNTATTNSDIAGAFNTIESNFIGDAGTATGFVGTQNRFGVQASILMEPTLALNGGLTPTYALLPSSPAINATTFGVVMPDYGDLDADGITGGENIPYDQRGVLGYARLVGTRVDLGAFEYQCPATMPDPVTTVTELYQAIRRANCDGTNSTINLSAGATFTLSAIASMTNGNSGLPDILPDGTLTINGNGATIERSTAVGTPDFRLFYVLSNNMFTLKNVVLRNGVASQGGAVFVQNGIIGLFNNTWLNNTAQGSATTNQGGALYNNAATVYLTNNTFSGNSAIGGTTNQGGAVYNNTGTTYIRHNTFTQNSASEGGAIYKFGGYTDLFNNIIIGNTAATNPDIVGAFNVIEANFIGDAGTATGFTGTQNRFGMQASILIEPTLALNGGLTPTYALLASSPAINASTTGAVMPDFGDLDADGITNAENIPYDQRGVLGYNRVVASRVDIGAFEYQCPATMPDPVTTVAELYQAIHRANCDGVNSTINLAPGTTFTLSAIASITNGNSGLPDILPDGTLTINGNGAIIERSTAGGTPNFRLFYVANNGLFTLKNVVLRNGVASQGGAIYVQSGIMAFFNNAWVNNTAQGGTINQGGALYNANGGIYLANSTFSGNSATGGATNEGGAVYSLGFTTLVRHNTFTQNSASEGGAVFRAGGNVDLADNIITGNTAATNPDVAGAFVSGNGNFIGNVGTATGITGTQNRFGVQAATLIDPTLALNGGLTLTHALLPGSPAINGGAGISVGDVADLDADGNTGEPFPYDQRGLAGFVRVAIYRIDAGSYEYQCPATMPDPVTTVTELYQAIHRANCDGVNSTINLSAGATFTLASAGSLTVGSSGLPTILPDGTLTINGNGAIIERSTAVGTPDFRLIYIDNGSNLTLNDLTIRSGVASQGGAIYNNFSTLILNRVTLSGNTAQGGTSNEGGAIYSNGIVSINSSTLSGNTAIGGSTSLGGAIYLNNNSVFLTNSTLSGNSANGATTNQGGAIYQRTGGLTLNLVTMTGNSATDQGGGIYVLGGGNSIITSVIVGNTAATAPEVSGGFNSTQTNVLGDVTGSTGFTNDFIGYTAAQVLNTTLANNGGTTLTHALIPGSPAINRVVGCGQSVDQRGIARPFNDANMTPDWCDAGAFEYQANVPTVVIAGGSVVEGDSGTVTITFTVTRSGDLTGSSSVRYATANNTATAGADYVAANGTVSFAIGETVQTFTITVNGDEIDEANETFNVNLSVPIFAAITTGTGVGTIQDDDTAGVTVTAPLLASINEAGAPTSTTFTIVLDTQPVTASYSITVPVTTPDGQCSVTGTATFSDTGNPWNTPITLTINSVDDLMDDGDVACAIVVGNPTGDAQYNAINPTDQSVLVVDNDTAGVTVTAPVLASINEAGAPTNTTFTIVLDTQPLTSSYSITVPVTTPDGQCAVTGTATFSDTGTPWNTPITLTINAVDDLMDDGDVNCAIVVGNPTGDAQYNAINPTDQSILVVDNDSVGVTVTAPVLASINEAGAPGSTTFTIVLDTQPVTSSYSITVPVTTPDGQCSITGTATFSDTGNAWNTPITLTINAVDDPADDGDLTCAIVVGNPTGDAQFNTINPADQSVLVVDNDVAGVTVTSPALASINEAGAPTNTTFTIVLDTQPLTSSYSITVPVTTPDGQCTVSGTATFSDTGNPWNTPISLTIEAVDDLVDDGDLTCAIVVGNPVGDAQFNTIDPGDTSVIVVDNDAAGVTVTAPALASINEAGAPTNTTFTLVLDTQPLTSSYSITVPVTTPDGQCSVTGTATFSDTGNPWNTPITLTIEAVDDLVDDGDVACAIAVGNPTGDAQYAAVDPADTSVIVVDDDTAGVTVSAPVLASINESGAPTNTTFTIVLDTQPLTSSYSITVPVTTPDGQCAVTGTATFSDTGNLWNTPITLTIDAVDDLVDDGDVACAMVVGNPTGDAQYAAVDPADTSVIVVDDDMAGLLVSLISGDTSENASSATFTITLQTQPSVPVTITLSSSNATEGAVTSPVSATLTFTSADWNIPQTVTVTGVDDPVADGNIAYQILVSASGGEYTGLSATVDVINQDNDTPGVTIMDIPLVLIEAGTGTYTFRLNTQPTAPVIITLTSVHLEQCTVDVSPITILPADYNTVASNISLTLADDLVSEQTQTPCEISYSIASADTNYNGLTPPANTIIPIQDNDPGIYLTLLTPPSLNVPEITPVGAEHTDSFTLQLNAAPTADVFVALTADDGQTLIFLPGGTPASSVTLTFSAATWNIPQVVTVQAFDDALVEDQPHTGLITLTILPNSAPEYVLLGTLDPIQVWIEDNDLPSTPDPILEYIVKAVDKSIVQIGETVTYTITFNNPKPISLTQVVITDTMDARFENIQVISSSIGSAIVSGNTITLQGFVLLPGQKASVVISAQVSSRAQAGDVILNVATLESPDASIHTSNTVPITILPGELPATGQTPWWRWVVILVLGLLITTNIVLRTRVKAWLMG